MYFAYEFKQTNLKNSRTENCFAVFSHTVVYYLICHCHVAQLKNKAFSIPQDIAVMFVIFSFVIIITLSLCSPNLFHHNIYTHGFA